MLKRITTGTVALAFVLLWQPAAVSQSHSPAYFLFEQGSPEGKLNNFVFRLDDPAIIAEARAILSGGKSNSHVQGKVVADRAAYNPEWAFHLAPSSIGFFEFQIEVCDANMTYVEEHLDEVGGSFLPNRFWCPWSSLLKAEVTHELTGRPSTGGDPAK